LTTTISNSNLTVQINHFGAELFSLKNSKSIFDMFYINGIVFYILVAVLFHYIYNNYNANKVNIIWACISIVLAVILGAIFENESITLNKTIAVFFSIVAIYFAQ